MRQKTHIDGMRLRQTIVFYFSQEEARLRCLERQRDGAARGTAGDPGCRPGL